MKPLQKSQVTQMLRRFLRDALRPYWIGPMDEPTAPDVSCDFEVSGFSYQDAIDDLEEEANRFVERVRRNFKDRVADLRIQVVRITDREWARQAGYGVGNYFVTLTASLTTLG